MSMNVHNKIINTLQHCYLKKNISYNQHKTVAPESPVLSSLLLSCCTPFLGSRPPSLASSGFYLSNEQHYLLLWTVYEINSTG